MRILLWHWLRLIRSLLAVFVVTAVVGSAGGVALFDRRRVGGRG